MVRAGLALLDNGSWITARIAQLVEQWTVMQQVPGSIPTQSGLGLTQPSIPLWVGKMRTSKAKT